MKTISIRLEDTIRERSIPFIISAPAKVKNTGERDKLAAFTRLEASRKLFS